MIRKLFTAFPLTGIVGVAALAAALVSPAAAQTFVGPAGGTFSTPANWDGGAVPAFNNTTAIVLNSLGGSTTAFGIVNDLVGVSTLNSLTLSSTGNTTTTYRPITLTATPTTNSLEFAGTNPTIVGNFAGGFSNAAHNINTSVSFTADTLITATNVALTSNITFGGTGQTFNTNGNTITARGANASTVGQGQINVNVSQTIAGAAKFAVTGGTGSSTTAGIGGGSVALSIGASTALASGASAEITLRGGANGTGATTGTGGGATLQYSATNNAFTPLVIFSNAAGSNTFASKTLALSGNSGTVAGLSSTGQSTAYFVTNGTNTDRTLTIDNSANYSYGGRFSNNAGGALNIVKNGAGTQTLTGSATANQLAYTGTTTVNAGVLTFATTVNNTLPGLMTVNGGTLNVGSAGASVLTLSGGVTVNTGGVLNVNPGAVISAVNANGGTIGGTGTLPAFTLQNTATLSPGVGGTGVISAAGLTMNGGSTIAFELNQANPALSDRVSLSGAFTKGTAGLYTFDFGSTTLTGANTFDLVTFTGTDFVAGDFTLTGLTAPGFDFSLNVTGTTVQLVSSAAAVVPETGTGALAALGLVVGIALPVIRRRNAR